MEALLGPAADAAVVERIALLTGELFQTDSLAADGRDVQWSRDGRYASFASGTGPGRKLHLVTFGERPTTTVLPGRNLVFSPLGTEAAYLGVAETLLIMMQQHNMKEENVLYPMCDQHLAAEMAQVVQRLETELAEA